MIDDTKTIYYLAQAYTHDPKEAFEFACDTTLQLRQLGHIVFSPILHTHAYDQYFIKKMVSNPEDYYQWDLDLLESFKQCMILVKWEHIPISTGVRRELYWAVEHQVPILDLMKFLEGRVCFIDFKATYPWKAHLFDSDGNAVLHMEGF